MALHLDSQPVSIEHLPTRLKVVDELLHYHWQPGLPSAIEQLQQSSVFSKDLGCSQIPSLKMIRELLFFVYRHHSELSKSSAHHF